MTCRRCQGLMIERPCCEPDWQHVSSRWPTVVYLWGCVICGNYHDATIALHQAQQRPEPMTSRRHTMLWNRTREAVKKSLQEVAA